MKKILPIIVFVVVAAAALFFVFRPKGNMTPGSVNTQDQTNAEEANLNALASQEDAELFAEKREAFDLEGEEIPLEEIKPATEVYSSADQALEAVKKAAIDYDDLVLEQFTNPGPDCTWCGQFYTSIKELLNSAEISQEAKGYYAELLAVSGRVDNISMLVDAVKNSKDTQESDIFAEALELTMGNEDVVRFLGGQMESANEAVQEASIAAVTNQGTRLAAELLYNQTVKAGDPDGYYSRGIGLGEFIPDPEAMPYLQELVKKQDQYSPLAVKALINSGLDGLRLVFDDLATIKDPELQRTMLSGAGDHLPYDEGTEELLQNISENSQQPVLADFAKKALEDYKNSIDENSDANMSIDPSLGGTEDEE